MTLERGVLVMALGWNMGLGGDTNPWPSLWPKRWWHQAGGQTRERQVSAPATPDGCGSLPAHGLGEDPLGRSAILGGRPSRHLLVGLGGRLGAKLSCLLDNEVFFKAYLLKNMCLLHFATVPFHNKC